MTFIFVSLLTVWGYRGHILFFLLACYIVFSIRIKPFRKKTMFILILLIIASWPVVETARRVSIKDRNYKEIFSTSTKDKRIIETFIRTPGQMITAVTRTIDLYPNAFSFLYGRTYLQAIYYILPNFSEEKRNGTLLSFSQEMSKYYFGGIAMEGGGEKGIASTPLAEAYANFGVFGLILLFLIGYIARKAELSLAKSFNPVQLAMYGIVSFLLLWTMRNDSQSLFRNVLYAYILVLLIEYIAKQHKLRVKII